MSDETLMKIRRRLHPSDVSKCHSINFNMSALSEVLVWGDSYSTNDLDIKLPGQNWKSLHEAMKNNEVITDNENTCIFIPTCEEDKKRGYTL